MSLSGSERRLESRRGAKFGGLLRVAVRVFSRMVLVVIVGLVAAVCESMPEASDFQVGMSRQQVLDEFGEPLRRQSLVKSDEFIMGPIETFWSSLLLGARVEIWSYPAAGGAVELYFVDGSAEVQGKGFAAEGAVY